MDRLLGVLNSNLFRRLCLEPKICLAAARPILAELLKAWRAQTAHAGDNDYVFASRRTSGRTARFGSVVVEDYLRPAAIRAEVLEINDGKIYIDGDFVNRFGFHTFRHSLTSWLMANGENPQIVGAMLRWTNLTCWLTTLMASKPTSLRLRVRC